MTTNEQAEYTPTIAELRAEWVRSRFMLTETAKAHYGFEPHRDEAEFAAEFDRAVAGERHRVAATLRAAMLELHAPRTFDGMDGPSCTECSDPPTLNEWPCTTVRALDAALAAFPAVGGSTPAVDGEGTGERTEHRYKRPGQDEWQTWLGPLAGDVYVHLMSEGAVFEARTLTASPWTPAAVPDSLPLDPEPGSVKVESAEWWWFWCPACRSWELGEGTPDAEAGVDQLREHEAEFHD